MIMCDTHSNSPSRNDILSHIDQYGRIILSKPFWNALNKQCCTVSFLVSSTSWSKHLFQNLTLNPPALPSCPLPTFHRSYKWNKNPPTYLYACFICDADKWKSGNFEKCEKSTFLLGTNILRKWPHKLHFSLWSKTCSYVQGRPKMAHTSVFPTGCKSLAGWRPCAQLFFWTQLKNSPIIDILWSSL